MNQTSQTLLPWTDNLWCGGKNELFVTSSTGNCFITITYACKQTATSSLFSLPFPAYPNPEYIASPVSPWGAKPPNTFWVHFELRSRNNTEQRGCMVITTHSGSVNRWPPMTSVNGNLFLRTENSVFLAPESLFYLQCVIFSLLHFFGRRPKGAWPKWPSGKYACGTDTIRVNNVCFDKRQWVKVNAPHDAICHFGVDIRDLEKQHSKSIDIKQVAVHDKINLILQMSNLSGV